MSIGIVTLLYSNYLTRGYIVNIKKKQYIGNITTKRVNKYFIHNLLFSTIYLLRVNVQNNITYYSNTFLKS